MIKSDLFSKHDIIAPYSSIFNRLYLIVLSSILILLFSNYVYAQDDNNAETTSHFVSLKVSQANLRTGPNIRYPIIFVYLQKYEPFQVIGEFENWKKVRDYDGEEGWLFKSALSNKKYAVIDTKSIINLYEKPSEQTNIVAKIEPKVRVMVQKCEAEWCKIKKDGVEGWVVKKSLWGSF
jgi:SH3-like domain-containing protein